MAQRAVEGDEEALQYLSLEESDVKWTTASTLTWETLCANYNYCAHVLVVATHLKLDVMRRTSRYALQSLTWIARHHYKKELPPIETTCTVEDLAGMMAAIVDQVPPPHLNRAEDVTASSSESESEEEEPASKKIKKTKEKSTKKQKKQKQEEKEETEATRSHHVRTRCRIPGCEAVVCDIRRHLMVHVKRQEIHEDDVEGIAEVMRHGKRKHVVAKGNPEVRGTATKKPKKRQK